MAVEQGWPAGVEIANFTLYRLMRHGDVTGHWRVDGYIHPSFNRYQILEAIKNNYDISGPRFKVTVTTTSIPGKFEFNVKPDK